MNLDKLKEQARRFEQREEWRRAIEVYHKAIHGLGTGTESVDPSMYNKVGDLEMKAGDSGAALRAYEQAAELYADQGFYNNAIALCGKILRVNPGRTETYLRLAQLHSRKNVIPEAKRNLLEYVERMHSVGRLEDAFQAVKAFADTFSGNPDIRLMLSELLRAASRTDEAKEQLEKLAAHLEVQGDVRGARRTRERAESIDTDAAKNAPPSLAGSGLVFLDTGLSGPPGTDWEQRAGVTRNDDLAMSTELGEDRATEAETPGAVAEEDSPGIPDLLIDHGPDLSDHGGFASDGVIEVIQDPDGLTFEEPSYRETELDLPSNEALEADSGSGDFLTNLDFAPSDEADNLPSMELDRVEPEFLPDFDLPLDSSLPELSVELSAEVLDVDLPGISEVDGDLGGVEVILPSFAGGSLREDGGWEDGTDIAEGDFELTEAAENVGGAPAAERDPTPGTDDALFESLDAADLEEAALDRSDPMALRRAASDLLDRGNHPGGIEILEDLLRLHEVASRWEEALMVVGDLILLEPDNLSRFQKRVELAYHSGDRVLLVRSYLSLADALLRMGAAENALAVYQRVEELDPGNVVAHAAIITLAVPPPPAAASVAPAPAPADPAEPAEPAGGNDFVDLSALVMDPTPTRDTRMRVDAEDPVGDEDKDFLETLSQFKRGIEENLDSEDFQAQYDLGIAFKEMGLLDEAIAQFQKALRSPEGRLRASEALGICFYDKGRYAIAEAVLRRAIESVPGSDDEKIGLIYWLGRSLEILERGGEALSWYERALAVDIRFLDLGSRVQALGGGR